jgi:thiamine biosynthesis lipoprotein
MPTDHNPPPDPFVVQRPGGYANNPVPRRADPASLQEFSGEVLGTTWRVHLDNSPMIPRGAIRAAIERPLAQVAAQMSTGAPGSSLTRFNEAPPGSRHVLEPEFARALACALRWAASSNGAFDPTVGPLVSLWGCGLHAGPLAQVPAPSEIAAAHGRVGWQQLQFQGATRTITQPGGVWLDLSGIAKGFAVDLVADSLQALGLHNLMVEVGGKLRVIGWRPGGEPWYVMVETGGQPLRLGIVDLACAASSRRWQTRASHEGRWPHTIDPRTGEPVANSLASVTVLHSKCEHADALATALTVLGLEHGLAFAQRHKLAALFVENDGARQRDRAPPLPAPDSEHARRLAQIGGDRAGAGDDVEQDVPLRAEDHQRAQPDIRIELKGHDQRHHNRKQQVRREGGEELRHRLESLGPYWPEPDPHACGHPDQARQHDQHQYARQRQAGEAEYMGEIAPAQHMGDIMSDRPGCRDQRRADDRLPNPLACRMCRPGGGHAPDPAPIECEQQPDERAHRRQQAR